MDTQFLLVIAAAGYWAACWSVLGYAIGCRFGEGDSGAWLGLLLGPLGCAIVFSWAPQEPGCEPSASRLKGRRKRPAFKACPYCGRPVSGTGLVTCQACGQQSEQA